MKFSSIRAKILAAVTALLTTTVMLSLTSTTWLLDRSSQQSLQVSFNRTEQLVQTLLDSERSRLTALLRLVGSLPILRASVETHDKNTINDTSRDLQKKLGLPIFEVYDLKAHLPTGTSLTNLNNKLFLVGHGPIGQESETVGTLEVGSPLDDEFAAKIKKLTNSDVTFAGTGGIFGSSLPAEQRQPLLDFVKANAPRKDGDGGTPATQFGDHLIKIVPLSDSMGNLVGEMAIETSLADSIATKKSIFNTTLVIGVALLLFAIVFVLLFSRSISMPIVALKKLAEEIIATNDLSRRAEPAGNDEIAALGGSFNHFLTEIQSSQTKLQESLAQLAQAQKMDAIGQLAGGISHDFNNLLAVIMMDVDSLAGTVDKGNAKAREDLKSIEESTERAATLTRQLLAFSRRQVLEPKVLDLNKIVASMDKMLTRLIGEDIELVTSLDPGLAKVKADPGQLEQVIMNLAINARDAMPEGGKLTIATGNIDLASSYGEKSLEVPLGQYVVLTVADSGQGMDSELMSHIFEPFFTTKEKGKGTGLGLSTVFGIVKQSGGDVSVESEPGEGSVFRIYLPQFSGAAEEEIRSDAKTSAHQGSETILLVEDEARLRKVTAGLLRNKGYEVFEAGNGQEALAICAKAPGKIDLVVTDVIMPEMTGPEFVKRLSATSGGATIKVLYLSGYPAGKLSPLGITKGDAFFLEKPYNTKTLLEKIREVLG